jgi:hypothetical protein
MFDQLMTEITEEMWPFRSQIAEQEQVRAALALARQKRINEANRRIERKFLEGIGEVVATIDADIYHRFGLMYGYETVNSPDFLKSLLRDNPELRIKSRTTRCGIVVPHWDVRDDATSNIQGEDSADVCTEAAEMTPEDWAEIERQTNEAEIGEVFVG